MSPVVERSVTIASITSREMVSKDFALEGSDEKMRKAAHLMAQSLAGNLAAVSTREPLRVSMIAHLKSLLLQNGFSDQAVPEQIVFVIVSDNLDLACSVMEKTAAEKSITEIDESLSGAYLSRRKHRERSTQPFYDMTVFGASRYPSLLPESLRLRVGGLSLQQVFNRFFFNESLGFARSSLCYRCACTKTSFLELFLPPQVCIICNTCLSSCLMLPRIGTSIASATVRAS